MRVLITGVAGFVGARVAEMLLAEGHQVLGVDNLSEAYAPALKRYRLDRLRGLPGFSFQAKDIVNDPFVAIPMDCAAIIHLAGHAGVRQSVDAPRAYICNNVGGFIKIMELARVLGVPRVVYASSSSVYTPNGHETPFAEHDHALTAFPKSPYAASKRMLELAAHSYALNYGVACVGLRYFSVYGPAGRPDSRASVFQFVRCLREGLPIPLYGGSDQKRDFTYIDDAARATVLAATQPLPNKHILLNIGAGQAESVVGVVEQLARALGATPQYERQPPSAVDTGFTWANNEQARRLLGWVPAVPLWSGLAQCVAWYEANREWAKDVGW